MLVEETQHLADQDAEGAGRRQVDRGAAHRRAAELPARSQRLHRQRLPSLFVVPASGGTPRQITSGNFDHTGTDWTPDGRSILFSGLRSENATYQWRESEIYAVDVAGGAIRQLTKRKGPDGNPDGLPGRQARRLHRLRLDDGYLGGQQDLPDEHRRIEPAPRVGRLGSRAAELAVVGRRQRALLHRAERRLAEPVLPAAGQRARQGARRSRRARTC